MARKITPAIVPCPTCRGRCLNHRSFVSTRVVDYTTGRRERFFRCGPVAADIAHDEHEWAVPDVKPGDFFSYPELGDDKY